MNDAKCPCAQFDTLEGASVPAYIKAFLVRDESAQPQEKNRYRCRVCGSEWVKREPEVKSEGTRPSLVRLSN